MKKKIITVFLAHAQLLFATVYYENPYRHYTEFKVGDRVTWKITSTEDGVPLDDTTRMSELMSGRDYYGTSIWKWKYTYTTAPANGFPSISVTYTDYADGVPIHSSQKSSDEFELSLLGSKVGSPPDKELWEIGEIWETMHKFRETAQGALGDNSVLSSTFWITKTTTKGTFLGLELIETPWGPLYAAKIKENIVRKKQVEDVIDADANGTDADDIKLIKTRYDDDEIEKTEYWLKGLGLYKIIQKENKGQMVLTLKGIYDTRNLGEFSATSPSSQVNEEQTYQSFTGGSISPTSFSAITLGENASTLYLDSWTWNGAYPWVYNANTDSWFYYYFKGSACNAYDARTSKWYTFDGQQKTWVNAN
jgi:hypothetical protein